VVITDAVVAGVIVADEVRGLAEAIARPIKDAAAEPSR
jgi:hypothetical protein